MIDQLTNILLQSSWQILILSLIVWPLSRLSVRAYPNFAHILWVVILVKAVIPINITLPFQQIPIVEVSPVITGQFIHAATSESASIISINTILILIWLIGVGLLSAKLIMGEMAHRKRLRTAQMLTPEPWFEDMKAGLGIKQAVHLYMNENIQTPLMQGLRNVRIYLPQEYNSWTLDEQQSVLAHELTHVRRMDIIIIYLQAIVKTLYFFHPVVWLVNDQIDLEREKICDDAAIDLAQTDRGAYGKQLFRQLSTQSGEKTVPVLAGGFFMSDRSIIKRFRYIKEKRGDMMNKLKPHHMLLIMIVISIAMVIACSADSEPNIGEPESLGKVANVNEKQDWDHDTPPEPVGGFAGLQKNIIYPEIARKAGIEGTAILNLAIDEEGHTSDVIILKSAGHASLDSAAKIAAENSTWVPAKLKGEPVKTSIAIPIVFRLSQDIEADPPKSSQSYTENAKWRPIDPPGPVIITLTGHSAREDAQEVSMQVYIEHEGETITNARMRAGDGFDVWDESYQETRKKWNYVKWEAVPKGSNPEPMWFELPKEFIFVD